MCHSKERPLYARFNPWILVICVYLALGTNPFMKTSLVSLLLFFSLSGWAIAPPDTLDIKIQQTTGIKKAEALYDAISFYSRRDIAKARQYIKDSYALASEGKEPLLTAYSYLNHGMYYSAIGMADSCIYLAEKGRAIAVKENYEPFLIRAGVNLGRIYISAGKPEQALTHLYKTLELLEKHPDIELTLKVRVNITWAYLELKRYRDCISAGRKTLDMISPRYEYAKPYVCNNVAASYGALNQVDSARYFVMMGIPLAKKSNDYNIVANAYFILGNIYASSGQYDLAIVQFQEAKPYREKMGSYFFMVADLYVLSDLYYKKGDYQNGVKSGLEGLALAKKYNITLKFEGVYQSLAKNYEGLKDYKQSSHYYNLLAAAKDSVYQNATADAIAEMQAKYEAEIKDRKIETLNKDNELKTATIERNYFFIGGLVVLFALAFVVFYLWRYRQQQKQKTIAQEQKVRLREAQINAVIDSQERERKRFASDLHDGMGQLVSALQLNIQSIKQNNELEKRVSLVENSEQLLSEIQTEIRNIAFNLMPAILVKEGLISAVQELARRINRAATLKVLVSVHDVPSRFTDVVEVSVYRIVQELVSNIIKHSKAASITVSFTGYDEEIVLTIEDDGDGYDVSKFQNSEFSNGWRTIQTRINLIQGEIEFDTVPGRKGSTVIIQFPKRFVLIPSGQTLQNT